MTAQRARDADRQKKRVEMQRLLHEKQYQLGDRDDAPPLSSIKNDSISTSGKQNSIDAKFLQLQSPPAVIKISEGPRRVSGDALKSRQDATGFDARSLSKHRSAFELVSTLNAWHRPELKHFNLGPKLKQYQSGQFPIFQSDGNTPLVLHDDRPRDFFRRQTKCGFGLRSSTTIKAAHHSSSPHHSEDEDVRMEES